LQTFERVRTFMARKTKAVHHNRKRDIHETP
jgi:hypothetical protein